MKDWIVRNLPAGFELPYYRGVKPGDVIHIVGWRFPGVVDVRRAVRLVAATCEGGVMAVLDRPLWNQAGRDPWVAMAWTREGGKT